MVYEILNEKNMCNYYALGENPGVKTNIPVSKNKFEYLDDEAVIAKIIDFSEGDFVKTTFIIPEMHCSSCIWLLENLYKFDGGIVESKVDFLKKQLSLGFYKSKTSLRKVVELLTSIGYEPEINYETLEKKTAKSQSKSLYYKIGISGFVFANIMLLSFPEYLSINSSDLQLKRIFSYINVLLSLPVLFYCASGYFISAYKGLRKGILNIDFPISLGITALYMRSLFEIFFNSAPGYLDSFAGLIFLLTLGKLFQNKTYETLNFERNYKSYFPISVTVEKGKQEKVIPLSDLKTGDRIVIHNGELIPADSILFSGQGNIDYSFVTGESMPVVKAAGEMIYAGGRQIGKVIELEVMKDVSQGYLTSLWNNNFSPSEDNKLVSISNIVSKYFTAGILIIAVLAFLFWLPQSFNTAINAFISVLIVACPCALAMSTPFTLGNTLRIFGRNKFYLKNIFVIELLAKINHIIFDKTGTITEQRNSAIKYNGALLKPEEEACIKSLVRNSTHPLSIRIYNILKDTKIMEIENYKETIGEGISCYCAGKKIKIGSQAFVSNLNDGYANTALGELQEKVSSKVYLSIDGNVKGYYEVVNSYRKGLMQVLNSFGHKISFSLLSGDNDSEKTALSGIFPGETEMYFNQSPADKLTFVKKLQAEGFSTLMLGDGLNDAGALLQSDVGISVSEDTGGFSPACDAILDSGSFHNLAVFVDFSKTSVLIIKLSFFISFLYNLVGIYIAVQGKLSPLFAAVLMPLSSISVVVFATISTNFMAKYRGLK